MGGGQARPNGELPSRRAGYRQKAALGRFAWGPVSWFGADMRGGLAVGHGSGEWRPRDGPDFADRPHPEGGALSVEGKPPNFLHLAPGGAAEVIDSPRPRH